MKSTDRYALREAHGFFEQAYELLTEHGPAQGDHMALVELLNAWSLVHYYRNTIAEWVLGRC